ncbi:hypothetical protein EYC84_004685 [Monilinia fructicola]|uniref:ABC transmembrane type-1 domain-containing protein n=1 Tax=Monilinia fructicola TaxID=38448 RepID=A0A5M9K685_MONFR|nr:hypothetical protein EYC84_004685 [Monilinia fructicola]
MEKAFSWGIIKWCGIGGFASYTNAMIKFLQSKVSIAFRTRLTRYIHDLYLNDNLNYYKLSNLDGGVGQGADQFITQDLYPLLCICCESIFVIGQTLCRPLCLQLPTVPISWAFGIDWLGGKLLFDSLNSTKAFTTIWKIEGC